jgi:plastocyanin
MSDKRHDPRGLAGRAGRRRTPLGCAAAAGALLLALTACSSTSSATAGPSATAGSASAAAVSGTQIVISNFDFSPMTLTVSPGAHVTVVNHDSTAHTLTASSGNAFDTGDIGPGKSATFTAPTKPGSYSYICSIHQFMHGTLTVR